MGSQMKLRKSENMVSDILDNLYKKEYTVCVR